MMQSRILGRALTFCLVMSAVGSCRTSASPKGDQAGAAVKLPLVAAEPPQDAAMSDYHTLGQKSETLAGPPRNCGGGAYQETPVNHHLFVVPEGVPVGAAQTIRIPFYELAILYEAHCSPVPSARF